MTLPTRMVRDSTLPLHREYPIVWVEDLRVAVDLLSNLARLHFTSVSTKRGDILDMNQGGARYSLAYRGYDPDTSYHLVDVIRNVF
jgi:hypothetical protein